MTKRMSLTREELQERSDELSERMREQARPEDVHLVIANVQKTFGVMISKESPLHDLAIKFKDRKAAAELCGKLIELLKSEDYSPEGVKWFEWHEKREGNVIQFKKVECF
jgi:hypothetical protein